MQTTVDYIFEQLEEQGLIFLTTKTNEMTISISASDYLDIKRLAKEMEKQQIIDALEYGWDNGHIHISILEDVEDKYYTSTYGSKGSDVMTPENHIGVLSEAVKKETTSSQTEISNEEILKQGNYLFPNLGDIFRKDLWEMGAKWYREQLKQRQ